MGESQTLKGPFTKWNALWNLNMPPRLRNFLWQAVKGILSIVVNLRAKGIDVQWNLYSLVVTKLRSLLITPFFSIAGLMTYGDEPLVLLYWRMPRRRSTGMVRSSLPKRCSF
nr:uncharacterized protein LOC110656165 [Ipomoea trifida]